MRDYNLISNSISYFMNTYSLAVTEKQTDSVRSRRSWTACICLSEQEVETYVHQGLIFSPKSDISSTIMKKDVRSAENTH